MKQQRVFPAILLGAGAAIALLLLFILVVRLLSGSWAQVSLQFREIGFYLVVLTIGFGAQVALWKHLRTRHKEMAKTHGVTIVSGSTSTIGMLACCTHYLANLVPFLGLAGLAGVLTAYQIPILVASIGVNILGIAYLVHQVSKASAHHLGQD